MSLLLEYIYRYGQVIITCENYEYELVVQDDGTIKIFETVYVKYKYDKEFVTKEEYEKISFNIDSEDFMILLVLLFNNFIFKNKGVTIKCSYQECSRNTISATNQLFRKIMSVFSSQPEFLFNIVLNHCMNITTDSCPEDDTIDFTWSKNELTIDDIVKIVNKRIEYIKSKITWIKEQKDEAESTENPSVKNLSYQLKQRNNIMAQLFKSYYTDEYYESITLPQELNYEFLGEDNNLGVDVVDSNDVLGNIEKGLITDKNVLIIGESGVGKTTLVSQLAKKIFRGQVSKNFKYRRVLKINSTDIVSGCSLVGQLEKKVNQIISYLKANPDVILFIDEIHTLFGAGSGSKGDIDLANILKPYLSSGDIKVIGVTTTNKYDEYFKSDIAFNRRFIKIKLNEPNYDKLYNIIKFIIEKLASEYGIVWNFSSNIERLIIDTIIKSTEKKHIKYDETRCNPDISIGIIEKIFANAIYLNHENIELDDVINAIEKCEFLYGSVSKRLVQDLKEKIKQEQENPISGVIQFTPKVLI